MATNNSTNNTNWNINTDVYGIAENINNLQKRYIEDEDETTLSMGIFGFIADTEIKKIQIATIMAGQLGNEMFPTKANLTKNVLTHAIYHNIEGINATPAKLTVTFCIKTEDIDKYIDNTNHFYLESSNPIFLDQYEFHFDYDIAIMRKRVSNGYAYSAQYIVADENDQPIINTLSDIINPYLPQPFIINIGDFEYLGIQCTIRQCSITTINDTMISDSIIENKTYEFQFSNQLAGFNVTIIQNDQEINITPYLYGANVDSSKYYCWYVYVSDDTVRITFDGKSFIPELNSKIIIKTWTTLGADGNFDYLGVDGYGEGVYVDITSDNYSYKSITTYMEALTNSEGGSDRKSKEELQKLIPKAALSRGSVTTETDLTSYFDLINTDINRIVMQKKIDNQLARVWYGYFLLKDEENNIIPSNTVDIILDTTSEDVVVSDDGRYILPSGTVIKYNPITKVGEIVDDGSVPPINSAEYFASGYYYYVTMYNLALSRDPMYCAYYLTNRNSNSYFVYDYVNDECEVQFIANHFHFERQMLTNQDIYSITFKIAQSIIDDSLTMYNTTKIQYVDENGNTIEDTIIDENVKVIMVFYLDNAAYRWCEADLIDADPNTYIYSFKKEIITDSMMDSLNRLKILGLNEVGSDKQLYGYFDEITKLEIYIMAKLPEDRAVSYSRRYIDDIAPGYEDFTVTNIYYAVDGISFFTNFTNIMNTKVVDIDENSYIITGVPMIGRHYMSDESHVKYLLNAIDERKAYIDYCLNLLENSMNIDFRYFNTYGPSETYTIGDKDETTIGNIDIVLRFRISFKDDSDTATRNEIIKDIKAMIENLNKIDDWHASYTIQEIMNTYEEKINFIEFVGFNDFDAEHQHIVKKDIEDPSTVPEFINVRNIFNDETNILEPCIEIESVV